MAAPDYRTIPAFCINLDRRTDRWTTAQAKFKALEWPVERFSAVSYTEPTVGGIDGRHAGALDSHRGCWRLCLERNYPMIAVFEDDVVFSPKFKAVFPRAFKELPPGWRFWQFHSSHAKIRPIPGKTFLVRIVSKGWGAHGYLVTADGCRDLLAIEQYNHCDVLMTRDYIQHGGQPFGMPNSRTLCFQEGDNDSDIPVTTQHEFWLEQRLKYCR